MATLAVAHCCAAASLSRFSGERGDDRKGRPYAYTAKPTHLIPPRDQMVLSSTDVSKCFTLTQNNYEKYHPAAQHTNLPFSRKMPSDFVIFPEIVLDNSGGVWYHTQAR